MEVVNSLIAGFGVAITPTHLLFCVLGVILGTFVGIMPGLGPSATIAMLLPLTFGQDPTSGLIMLAGIYYGAKYGGASTSILVNLPGEGSSVMTCLDGYELAKKGRGGTAIGVAAIGSFLGGTVGVIGLTVMAPPLAAFALSFGPPEYFSLLLMGLVCVAFLAGKSMIKALMMGILGLMISVVGTDEMAGADRFVYDQMELLSGISFPIVGIGLFAIGEILTNVDSALRLQPFAPPKGFVDMLPTWPDVRKLLPTFGRSTVLGFFVGVLPGAGATIASFLAYGMEKAISRHPEKFGTGTLEGVAAPETADNASTAGAMVPLFTLGVPGSGSTAMLLAALMMLGLRPGPLLMTEHPDVFWGVVASMYIGNVFLLVLNLPLAPVMASVLRVPYAYLYTAVFAVCLAGVYSLDNSMYDVWLTVLFGILGYLAKKLDYPRAPAVLGLVLGPMVERALRQSLILSRGDYSIFVTSSPVSAVLLTICAGLVALAAVRATRERRTSRQVTEGGEMT